MSAKIIPVGPFDIVVFGGTGDLSLRKLMPSLYYREKDNQLPEEGRIIGISRAQLDRDAYIEKIHDGVRRFVKEEHYEAEVWERFARRLHFLRLDALGEDGWSDLATLLEGGEERARVFYLSTSPGLFGPISKKLAETGLVIPNARVVLEKPIGHDLESACKINDEVGSYFEESQVFRIDHYLGKETVQNLMALRFANSLFEPLWNREWIDHVQITVAESIGIEDRGGYYDHSGALRDMIQNHLIQLLCLVAMEPPGLFEADSVRDEKLKILRSLVPIGSDVIKNQNSARTVC